ncbi:hypothetical protein ES708_09482 [subsurface metagenome]
MGDDALREAVPLSESALILSGPDDSIFDDIWDWIQNAVSSVGRIVADWVSSAWSAITNAVTTWVTWIWNSVWPWLKSIWDWIISVRDTLVEWVSTKVGELWNWITTSLSNLGVTIGTWFSEQWSRIWALFTAWGENIAGFFASQAELIGSYWSEWYKQRTEEWTEMQTWMTENILGPLTAWWDQFLERVFDVGKWIGGLLDGIVAWLMEDVPGHSPRFTAIFETIGDWFLTWFVKFPQYMFENFPEKVAYGLSTSLRSVGLQKFNTPYGSFWGVFSSVVSCLAAAIAWNMIPEQTTQVVGFETWAGSNSPPQNLHRSLIGGLSTCSGGPGGGTSTSSSTLRM